MGPEQLANYMASLNQKYHPSIMVADIEYEGKGYQGSAGWDYNERFASQYQKLMPNVPWAVTMMPMQDDYNYKAYTSRGAEIWPQAYGGGASGTEQKFDPQGVVDRVAANGVDRKLIRPTLAPGQSYAGGAMYTVDDIYAGYGGKYPKVGEPVTGTPPSQQQPLPPPVKRPEQTDPDPYPPPRNQTFSTDPVQQAAQAVQQSIAPMSYVQPAQPTDVGMSAAQQVAARAQNVLDSYLGQQRYTYGMTQPVREPAWSAASRVAQAAARRQGGYFYG
jgi:hypothetical protein